MKPLNILLALCALAIAPSAVAHFMWLEQADGQTKLYFGEYQEGLREKTGGRLDTIATPEARLLSDQANKISLKRQADYIAVETAKAEPVISQELGMKVKDMTKYHWGIAKPMYYARIGSDAAEEMSPHALDIQPMGHGKVRVNLNGQPLAKAKLTVMAPNQWLQEFKADDKGEVTFNMPWPGLYVLEVIYLEPKKGAFQGEAYENIRHVSTFSVIKK